MCWRLFTKAYPYTWYIPTLITKQISKCKVWADQLGLIKVNNAGNKPHDFHRIIWRPLLIKWARRNFKNSANNKRIMIAFAIAGLFQRCTKRWRASGLLIAVNRPMTQPNDVSKATKLLKKKIIAKPWSCTIRASPTPHTVTSNFLFFFFKFGNSNQL